MCFIFIVCLLPACSLDKFLFGQSNDSSVLYKDPHTFCDACHTTAAPGKGFATLSRPEDPSSMCLDCHDYEQNHHPVNFKPPDTIPVSLPLVTGEVRCLTCHEIHGASARRGGALLRGGPYSDRRDICFKCHANETYAGINPHIMLDENSNFREVNGEPVCLICHAQQPDPAVDWTNDIRLKADIAYLCWRCHPPMPDPFFSTHFLVKPSAPTLERMKYFEEEKMVILPLVPRGRITCSTCHNPHQEGVIIHKAAAEGSGERARLRQPSLCGACHPY